MMAPSDMKPKLYYFPTSFYSQKVLFALEEKQVPYEKCLVDLANGEIYAPWYMALNSKGQVPILQHDNKCIADSKTITEYIEQTFDGPALIPKEFESEINEIISLTDSIQIPILTYGSFMNPELVKDPLLPAVMISMGRSKVVNNRQQELLKKYKGQCNGNKVLEAAYQAKIDAKFLSVESLGRDRVIECLSHAAGVFDQLEKRLKDNVQDPSLKDGWLVSKSFTAADIALAVCIQRLVLVGFSEGILSTRPYVTKYLQKLHSEKPNFIKVCVNINIKGYIIKKMLSKSVKVLPIFVGLAAVGVGVWYYFNRK